MNDPEQEIMNLRAAVRSTNERIENLELKVADAKRQKSAPLPPGARAGAVETRILQTLTSE